MLDASPGDSNEAPAGHLTAFLTDGPDRWFDLDVAYFATALPAALGEAPDPAAIPVRFEILLAAVSPDTTPDICDNLADKAVAGGDGDAAAIACVQAIDRIVLESANYERLRGWAGRCDVLLDRGTAISARARCALLLRRGIVTVLTDCDLAAAEHLFERQRAIALELRSISQRLQHASWRAYVDCHSGHLYRSDLLLTEALTLCQQPGAPLIPRAMVASSYGMVKTLQGQPDAARTVLRAAMTAPDFSSVPPFIQEVIRGHLLYALAQSGQQDEIAELATTIREHTVPENRVFMQSYLHFSLGAFELRRGAPHRALIHAEQGLKDSRTLSSGLNDHLLQLLRLQALADLRRDGEAFGLLQEWLPRWRTLRMDLVSACALLEKSGLHARLGEIEPARKAFFDANHVLPESELPCPLNRDAHWRHQLRASLFPHARPDTHRGDVPVRIRTLGRFTVEIDGHVVYDRDWHGRRSKSLLQGLIALGGQKVSSAELADMVWPDSDGVQAQQNLKAVLWRLRRLGRKDGLDPLNWIHVKHGKISLPRTLCSIDALEFEAAATAALAAADTDALRDAFDLYGGEFLPGETDPPAVNACRQRLHQLWTRLQERQTELDKS